MSDEVIIKLSDYVIDFLMNKGIRDVFLVSGGGVMHLLDSVGRNKKIRFIANRHEQASATAAESYARTKNVVSVCLVTTGPGGTNAITGVAGAWVDSIPMIVLSGQVKRELIADHSKLRQLGPQEIDIVPMVKPITKYASLVTDPNMIRYELEKAYYFATTNRPGPVWLDIPLDVQGAMIDKNRLAQYKMPTVPVTQKNKILRQSVAKTIEMILKSKRPILIFGNGVRLAHAEKLLPRLVKKLPIPVLLPINGMDLVPENGSFFVAKFGPFGQRSGNFVLQNSDLILSVGASLSISCIGFNYAGFAPNAKKIMVNIDRGELEKTTLKIDLPIESDAKLFIEELLSQLNNTKLHFSKKWLAGCSSFKKRYPTVVPEFFKDKKHVNSYVFFDTLSNLVDAQDIITTGIGLDATSMYQSFRVKKNQRAFVNQNFGQMGWCLPAAVGACVANNRRRTICVTGDGSLQLNIQELLTIKYYHLPIKIFVFNNAGYESIRATQNNFFEGRLVGSDESSGYSNPDFRLLARTHGLQYEKIKTNGQLSENIKKILAAPGPVLCEVNVSYTQKRMPRSASYRREDGTLESRPLEDMFPFLPREEISANMQMFDKEKK